MGGRRPHPVRRSLTLSSGVLERRTQLATELTSADEPTGTSRPGTRRRRQLHRLHASRFGQEGGENALLRANG